MRITNLRPNGSVEVVVVNNELDYNDVLADHLAGLHLVPYFNMYGTSPCKAYAEGFGYGHLASRMCMNPDASAFYILCTDAQGRQFEPLFGRVAIVEFPW